jgi:hypothetical protein
MQSVSYQKKEGDYFFPEFVSISVTSLIEVMRISHLDYRKPVLSASIIKTTFQIWQTTDTGHHKVLSRD